MIRKWKVFMVAVAWCQECKSPIIVFLLNWFTLLNFPNLATMCTRSLHCGKKSTNELKTQQKCKLEFSDLYWDILHKQKFNTASLFSFSWTKERKKRRNKAKLFCVVIDFMLKDNWTSLIIIWIIQFSVFTLPWDIFTLPTSRLFS